MPALNEGGYELPSGVIARIKGGGVYHKMITAPTNMDLWVFVSEDEWS